MGPEAVLASNGVLGKSWLQEAGSCEKRRFGASTGQISAIPGSSAHIATGPGASSGLLAYAASGHFKLNNLSAKLFVSTN